jgi:hypothetical protein
MAGAESSKRSDVPAAASAMETVFVQESLASSHQVQVRWG